MANTITTPLMSLVLPIVGTQVGPTWAANLNSALTLVDSHNHQPGNGPRITTAALSIDGDLSLGSFNLTFIRALRLNSQTASLSGAAEARSVYSVAGDLYYSNGSGTPIQLTAGTGLNAASLGAIGGDYATSGASESYSSITKTFSFTQSSGVTAKMACGDVSIFENVASAQSITLKSPSSLAASFNLTLPPAIPSSGNKVLTLDSTGAIASVYDFDNSTLEVASNSMRVKDLGITTAKLNTASVTKAKLFTDVPDGSSMAFDGTGALTVKAGGITQDRMATRSTGTTVGIGGVAISASSGSYTMTGAFADVTNLSITITTTGRPVVLILAHDGTAAGLGYGTIFAQNASGNIADVYLKFLRNSADLITHNMAVSATGASQVYYSLPSTSITYMDTPAAGTYTYKVQAILNSGTNGRVLFVKLVAYEI